MNLKQQHSKILYAVIFSCLLVLQACTGKQTTPNVARAGDTVSIAIGSAEGMNKLSSNTTAVYVPDAGGSYPLTIRAIFNLYPDKKSSLYNKASNTQYLISSSNHEAWQTVMVIDLPLNVPVGTGKIHVDTIASFPTIVTNPNFLPIGLEIIDGVGSPDTFEYDFSNNGSGSMEGDLSMLEPLPHALVKLPFEVFDEQYYGAIEMRLTLPTGATRALRDDDVRVVVDDMTPYSRSSRNVVWGVKGSVGNDELVVMMMSTSGSLISLESRFSIVMSNTQPKFQLTTAPTILEVNYYDINGNLVAGKTIADYLVALN